MEESIEIEWFSGQHQINLSIKDICSCICTIYHNGKARIMVIDSVFTAENSRNKGYATKLMEFALKFAKENYVDSVELIVNKDNNSAKRIYKKVGFEKTNKDHYRIILNHG